MNHRFISFDPDRRYVLRSKAFWKDFARKTNTNDLAGESAKLSFFVVLASVPYLLIVFTMMSLLPTQGMEHVLVDILARLVPKAAVPILREHMVHTLTMNAGFTVWIGALGSLFIAARAVAVFEHSINNARGTPDTRSFARGWAERILIAGLLGLFMSLAPTALLSGWRVTELLAEVLGVHSVAVTVWQVLRFLFVPVLVSLAASMLYAAGTAIDRPWRWITPGSALATLGWLAGSLTFKFMLRHFEGYNVIYGSLGSIFSAMAWIYMSCMFFLGGALLDGLIDRSIYPIECESAAAPVTGTATAPAATQS